MSDEIEKTRVSGNSSSRVVERSGGTETYFTGAVSTPYGFVVVYGEDGYADISFIHNGFEYRKKFRRWMSKQALATAAGRFAKEIALEQIK